MNSACRSVDDTVEDRYIYLPRGTDKDTIGPGKRLGLVVTRAHQAPDDRGTSEASARATFKFKERSYLQQTAEPMGSEHKASMQE
jgi:hypothetical protein